jgi:tRNA(fMet)-specific endonuclease VapC
MIEFYMLDTDICSYLMRENPASLIEQFKRYPERVLVSVVTCAELLFGADKKDSEKLKFQIMRFLSLVEIVNWDMNAAKRYARARSELERRGMPIQNMDLMIAASALSKGYTLVSNNVKHFKNIPDLKFEIWL